jgi:hypothetical protein
VKVPIAAALLLACAAVAQADAKRSVCFIGPVFLEGVKDGACVADERERKRWLSKTVVDFDRKAVPLVMRAERNAKDTITVSTCGKWLKAEARNRVAVSAQDRGREKYYQRACLTLDRMKFAGPSRRTHLAAGGKDLLKVDLVPSRLLEQAGIKGPLPLPGTTVGALSKAGELVLRDRKTGMMEVTWRNADLVLNPAARGDFDHDGIEDLAVAMEVVTRGSKRHGTMIVFLTRHKAGGDLEVMYPKARN